MNDLSPRSILGNTELRPLSFVAAFHEVRPVNPAYVERLRAKIREIGVKPYPLSVTPEGVLYGGRHRYEAFKAEGIGECLMHIVQPVSLDREAIELNRASEDALPMTFVDLAEMVWRRLAEGSTQQALADELGWSRELVGKYAALKKIAPEAWRVIGTTFQADQSVRSDGGVPADGTSVPFTESLLREITDLDAVQQLDLVRQLARGKNSKGHVFTKKDFKTEADRYRTYNGLVEAAEVALEARIAGERLETAKAEIAETLKQRIYLDEKQPGPRFEKLIQSYIDAYEEAMNSRVIVKDIRDLTAVDIADESVDAIVTDPPYPREFIELFDALGALAARVLKPGGSLLCLCGQSYLPDYIERLSRHLDYHWAIGVHMPGGQAVQLHDRQVTAFWKPILWFTKGRRDGRWASDFIRTDTNNNDKAHHHWGQSEQIMRGMVERVSLPGETVLDPFLGGGTTGVVCREMKRKFVGVEIDEAVAKGAMHRIGGAANG